MPSHYVQYNETVQWCNDDTVHIHCHKPLVNDITSDVRLVTSLLDLQSRKTANDMYNNEYNW